MLAHYGLCRSPVPDWKSLRTRELAVGQYYTGQERGRLLLLPRPLQRHQKYFAGEGKGCNLEGLEAHPEAESAGIRRAIDDTPDCVPSAKSNAKERTAEKDRG